MPTYRFAEVRVSRRRVGKCPVCGGTVHRARTFTQTVSPFHPALKERIRSEMSEQEAHQLVLDSVNAEADAWVPDFRHQKCLIERG